MTILNLIHTFVYKEPLQRLLLVLCKVAVRTERLQVTYVFKNAAGVNLIVVYVIKVCYEYLSERDEITERLLFPAVFLQYLDVGPVQLKEQGELVCQFAIAV